jgi:hypothetical protein
MRLQLQKWFLRLAVFVLGVASSPLCVEGAEYSHSVKIGFHDENSLKGVLEDIDLLERLLSDLRATTAQMLKASESQLEGIERIYLDKDIPSKTLILEVRSGDPVFGFLFANTSAALLLGRLHAEGVKAYIKAPAYIPPPPKKAKESADRGGQVEQGRKGPGLHMSQLTNPPAAKGVDR